MTKLKALYALQCRDYVLEQHGPSGLEHLKAEMAPAARDGVYADERIPTDWIEVEYVLEHGLAYSRAFSTPTSDGLDRMMNALATLHYRTTFRTMFLTAPSPIAVLEKSCRLWSRIYSHGETHLMTDGPNAVVKRIVNCPDLPRFHDRLTTPYYEGLVRAAGGQDVIAKNTCCVALGADCCETLLRWS
jgi:hypothetical protein